MTLKTADELVALGEHLSSLGNFVVILHPAEEWMAVETQTPFIRSQKLPLVGEHEDHK